VSSHDECVKDKVVYKTMMKIKRRMLMMIRMFIKEIFGRTYTVVVSLVLVVDVRVFSLCVYLIFTVTVVVVVVSVNGNKTLPRCDVRCVTK